MRIEGRDGQTADVNDENEVVTRSIVESELEHTSALGGAYSWVATAQDWTAGDTMLFVRNDSATPLILDRISLPGDSDGQLVYNINIGSYVAETLAGVAVTPVNINQIFSTTSAVATSYADETGVADASTIDVVTVPQDETHQHTLDGVILGKNHFIQVNIETATTAITLSCSLFAHFATPD